MPPLKKDKILTALESVHTALRPLTAQERQRVLASVHALLETSTTRKADTKLDAASDMAASGPTNPPPLSSARPLAIRELIQDKKPSSNPELITLFAYYREKHENRATFSRDDLEKYYSASRENPPKNYDRDFVNAVKRGWIHEDDANSYITSKGIEAVESGFAGASEQQSGQKRTKRRKGNESKRVGKKRG
jgi:hypothetical protein